MHSQTATFPGTDGARLTARLDLPDGEPVATALFAHCFVCGGDDQPVARISRALTEQGLAVLRFDFTGLGAEGGAERAAVGLPDLVAAAGYLRQHHRAPAFLVGHSLGGSALLAAAAQIPEARAVATINAPSDPRRVKGLLGESPRLEEGIATATLGHRRFGMHGAMLDALQEEQLLAAVRELRKALLVFHAPFDEVVAIDNARTLYQAAMHPKSFLSLDTADHLISDRADAAYIAHVLAAWATRYLHGAPPAPLVGTEQHAPHRVAVQESGPGRLAQRIHVGHHRLRADEPLKLGGKDTGPTPYDLLLAALGACTSMTLRLYADRKDWPLQDVRVDLRHTKIHAKDCETCDTQVGKVDRIERTVHLAGPLDDEQRARLLEIADRCPVHRTLESEVVVVTTAGS